MAGSDCFDPFVIDSDYLLSSAAPARLPGQIEALPSLGVGCTCVPGFLRQRGARQTLAMTVLQVLPSADDKTSALRIISFTMLNHPGHTRRYRRFACILADAHARLAVKVVADLSFLPDLHRRPQHRFLGTRHLDCRSIVHDQIVRAIELTLPLADMLAEWKEVSQGLAEAPRARKPQFEQYFPGRT